MAQETLISPGVLTRENDLSQITQGPITVGLALVGPTVMGPVNIPTVVTSYSDFKNKFGGLFTSGGANFEFLTSIATRNYFQQGGTTALITRVTEGVYTPATSSLIPNGVTGGSNTKSTASMNLTDAMFNNWNMGFVFDLGSFDNVRIAANSFDYYDNTNNIYYIKATPDGGLTWGADAFGVAAPQVKPPSGVALI